ncbi:hypothetical protein, partial [Kineococcus indalonis]|uniref:hypothetical protein n=1 Tax=Kineococcus indalonis TaxID=2696566 RepID=UPI001412E56D
MSTAPGRRTSATAQLARAGFTDPARGLRLLRDAALDGVVRVGADGEPLDDEATTSLVRALGRTADPDQALLGLVRWAEALAAGADGSPAGRGR